MASLRVEVVGESDIGLVRERNEDAFLAVDLSRRQRLAAGSGLHRLELGEAGLLLSVLDGMGGAAAGDRASQLASEVFAEQVLAAGSRSRSDLLQSLTQAVQEANRRVREESQTRPGLQGMGTTLTAASLIDETLVLIHVGDSRAYLFRGGKLVQLTEDQSLIQELVASGQIPREEAPLFEHNNVILQALGVTDDLLPFAAEIPLQLGDLLLLCTDGLTTMVPEPEIQEVLGTSRVDLEAGARALTSLARQHGGHDNVTLLLARFEGEGLLPLDGEGNGAEVEVREVPLARPRRQGLSPMALAALAVLLMLAVAGVILLIGMDWR